MYRLFRRAAALIFAAVMIVCTGFTGSADDHTNVVGPVVGTKYNNPLSSQVFCADPTAVEYNGISALCGYADFANQSSTILKLHKYFLVNCS